MTLNPRYDPGITPRALSVSREAALAGGQARTGVSRPGILPAVERSLAGSAVAVPCGHSPRKRGALSLWSSPRHRVFRSLRLDGPSGPRLAARAPWPLPTPRPVARSGSPQARARCFPARPPHLPPRRNLVASLCGAGSPRRVGLGMRFLSIGPPVSAILPSAGRLPCRSWPRVAGLSCHHAGSSDKGLAPRLQRAHAGRTHAL